jgi:hypothetical protein
MVQRRERTKGTKEGGKENVGRKRAQERREDRGKGSMLGNFCQVLFSSPAFFEWLSSSLLTGSMRD